MTQTVSLGNLVDISSSKRIFYKEYVNSGVPFYRSKEIIERAAGKKNISTELFISEERFNEIESKYGAPKEGDLLLTSVGTLGIPYLVQQGERFYFKDGNLTWFRNFKPELNRNYFLYWLTSQDGKNELLNHTIGSTQKALTIQGLKKVKVPLPHIETQKKIADILGSIDEKIELNRKMNETLEQMGQALFRHYFIDNPEVEKWQVRELGDYLKVERGLSYKGAYLSDDSADMPMINLGSFALDGTYNENNIKYYNGEFKERTVVHPGDLVLANTDMTQDRVVLGAILRTPRLASKMLFTHHVYGLRNLKLPREFIYYLLKRPSFRERAQGFATGTTVLFMPAEAITKLHLKVPPEDLLDRFSNEAHVIFERKEIARIEIQTLTTLRAALLPRLINGSVSVKE